jgi:predicted metal-dependent phosphoesterase TrpH
MPVNLAQDPASIWLAAQDNLALQQVFEGVTAESCPNAFNFHIHTIYSDGKLHPEAVVEQAIAIGLKGLTITDHHSVSGYKIAQHYLEKQKELGHKSLPRLWTGTEINANLLDIEVHLLAYAFDPDHPAMQPYLHRQAPKGNDYQAQEVIAAIHAAGGLAGLAHPARYRLSYAALIPAAVHLGVDAVETYYAYTNPIPWAPSVQQTQAIKQLSDAFGLLNTCGTDTHGLNLLHRL